MKDQRKHWNEMHAASLLAAHATKQTEFAEAVNAALTPGSKLLELGCGEGNDSNYLAECGHKVTATDFSDVVIMRNKQRYNHPSLQFTQLDISKPFPFTDQSFDAVYARLSLHYFTDAVTRQAFAEIACVLKPGGKLCFMCKSTDDRLYGRGKQLEADMFESDGHVRHFFSESYVRDLLAKQFTIDLLEVGKEQIYDHISGFVKVIATKN